MRIMFFAGGGDIGGGKTHILTLAHELLSENEVRLLSFRHGVFSDEASAMGIDTVSVDHRKGYLHAVKTALAQVDKFKPDIVHCHGSKANSLGIIVKSRRGIPVITTVHSDPELDYLGSPLRKYTYGAINALSLRRMDYYVAVAGRMKQLLIERGFDPNRIFTVFNGLDFSGARESPRPEKESGLPINIGIAARLNPVKDIKTLIRAFAKAYAKDSRLRLKIAGVGEDENTLKKLAVQLGVSDVISFEGWVSDINEFFKDIDINVLSSLSETFPYSLLEGAYEHCPAIASNAGGIPYLIEHGKTGLLFECGDDNTFAEYILLLANDPKLRTELAENLFNKAKEQFSLQRMAADQQDIYKSVLRINEKSKSRYGAVLCGAYGRGNAGDEAILRAITNELRSIDKDMPVWVMSKNPEETRLKEATRSFYIFDILEFFKALRKAELFISGGGSLIQDVTSARSLYFYLFTLKAAKRAKCKIAMYGCGIGPILTEAHKKITARVLNETADVITLRDSMSERLLNEIGVTSPEIIHTADPTFSLPSTSDQKIREAFASENIPEGLSMMGFCLRTWESFTRPDLVAKAAEYAYRRYNLIPVFLPIETPKDIEIGRSTADMLPRDVPRYVCTKRHQDVELIGMLGKMQLVCGMRLHSLIFATAAATPAIGISYDVKVDSFIREIESDACVKTEDLTEGILESFIDKAMIIGKAGGEAASLRLKLAEEKNGAAVRKLLEL